MELIAENGCIVSIPSGFKRKLGRGSELAILDKTVSRDQVLVELKDQREKFSAADRDSSLYGLFIEVLGANPVCILHIGQSTGGRSDTPEVVFLKKGEKDTMFVGDKISLSLSHPQFFTVQEGDGKKDSLSPFNLHRPGSRAEDDLLQNWKDRKNVKLAGPSVYHATLHSDAAINRCLSEDRDIAANEEEGIAHAVARRQKRALERRQQQAQKLHDERAKEPVDMSDVQQEAHEREGGFIETQNIDPVKEFGFLVEGSEFDQYKNRCKSNGGRWMWPPPASKAEYSSDDDVGDSHTRKRDRKAKAEEDDEEWRGDDQQEEVTVASAKERKLGVKVNLRSHEPSTSKIRDMSMMKTKKPDGRMVKNQREELEEDEDEADETLGGFIVNDDEEDPINGGDDADNEEEESSEDDEIDEADEDEDSQQVPKDSAKKREEKPLCKYGKNCYRKNPDHLAQFRHQ